MYSNKTEKEKKKRRTVNMHLLWELHLPDMSRRPLGGAV